MKRKCYGDTKTNLTLTEKAFNAYCITDPLSIYEREDGLYDIVGCYEATSLTAELVNKILEEFLEDCEEN